MTHGDLASEKVLESKPAWRARDVFYAYVAAIVASTTTASLGVAFFGQDGSPLLLWMFGQAGLWSAMAVAVVIACRTRGTGNLRNDIGADVKARDVPLGLVIGIVGQLALVPLIYVALGLVVDTSSVADPARDVVGELGAGWNIVPLAIGLVLIAPVVEELFYRGFVLRTFEARYGRTVGVVGSAALFGASHFQPLQLFGLFALGIVLATLASRFNRLGIAIVAHMGFNAVTTVIIVVTG
jgi:uncharacterized protein